MSNKTEEEKYESKLPLSQFDRIALKVATGLLLAGILYLAKTNQELMTSVALVEKDIGYLSKKITEDVASFKGRIRTVEKELQDRTKDRYTVKDASLDKQKRDIRFEKLELKMERLEQKIDNKNKR